MGRQNTYNGLHVNCVSHYYVPLRRVRCGRNLLVPRQFIRWDAVELFECELDGTLCKGLVKGNDKQVSESSHFPR